MCFILSEMSLYAPRSYISMCLKLLLHKLRALTQRDNLKPET